MGDRGWEAGREEREAGGGGQIEKEERPVGGRRQKKGEAGGERVRGRQEERG